MKTKMTLKDLNLGTEILLERNLKLKRSVEVNALELSSMMHLNHSIIIIKKSELPLHS